MLRHFFKENTVGDVYASFIGFVAKEMVTKPENQAGIIQYSEDKRLNQALQKAKSLSRVDKLKLVHLLIDDVSKDEQQANQ